MKKLWPIALVLFVSGCGFPFVFPSAPSNQPQRQFTHSETIEREPRFVVIEGKTYQVVDAVKQTYDVALQQTEPKKTLWQRLVATAGGWIFLWIVLMVLGLFFPPVALVMGLINRSLSKGVKRIVTGVDVALAKLPPEHQATVLNTLSSHYDDSTKKLVNDVKEAAK